MAEYRIDELARLADVSVRNIRVYQDRGLLAPPRRQGRVGIYTDAHLARLRLIGQLLKRGYTFANIAELLAVWESGGDMTQIFDFESALGDPWSDEVPGYVTTEGLVDLFGAEVTEENLDMAVRLGVLEPDGDRFRVPSPRLLSAGAELVAVGMPLRTVLDLAERLRTHVDAIARDLTGTVTAHMLAAREQDGRLLGEDLAQVAAMTRRLRPLAQTAVDAMLAQGMSQHVQEALGDHFTAILERMKQDTDTTPRSALPVFLEA
jgi:DNA-binding transcriptional MerR regulator